MGGEDIPARGRGKKRGERRERRERRRRGMSGRGRHSSRGKE